MDTKLRNRDNSVKNENSAKRAGWGILLAVLLVAFTSAATVALYPYMEKRAKDYYNQRSEQELERLDGDFGNISTQIMNFSYEIWHLEKQEAAGRLLTYSQTFLPKLEGRLKEAKKSISEDGEYSAGEEEWTQEEDIEYSAEYSGHKNPMDQFYYYRELQSMMEELGNSWKDLYLQYGSVLSYAVLGENGTYLRSNTADPKAVFSSAPGEGEMQFTASFSPTGQLSVENLQGKEKECGALLQEMSRFEFYDPMERRTSDSYRDSGVSFEGPENIKIVFRFSPREMNLERDWGYGNAEPGAYDYSSGDGLWIVVMAACIFLTVAALVLPFIKPFNFTDKAMFRLAFEPLSCIGVLWLMMMPTLSAEMVCATMNGAFLGELERAGFIREAAVILLSVLNVGYWFLAYGIYYWGITCYRAIFSLGLWRYFKERTWLGRFLRFIKRWVCRGIDIFNATDWESNSTKIIGKAVAANFIILSLISCLWFWGIGALIIYSIVLFFLMKKYWNRLQEKYNTLLDGIGRIAEGDLNVEIQEDLGVFNPFKEQLSKIQKGFRRAVEQEVKSERTKSELITNVSHDLKTPLTAIITYINLLQQEGISEEERDSYIQVLDQKSMRLKVLIEDLFEISKANSGTVSLHLEQVDIVSLLKQVRLELSDKIEASGVEFKMNLPEERIVLLLDSQKTYRIFENLMVNITKYGMPGTRAYIKVQREAEDTICISMRNISAAELTVSPEELTERFTRADASRNTEGSGLGLAIARSFVEAQKGTLQIQVEDDLFKVVIRWRQEPERKTAPEPEKEPETFEDGEALTGAETFQTEEKQEEESKQPAEDASWKKV